MVMTLVVLVVMTVLLVLQGEFEHNLVFKCDEDGGGHNLQWC